MKIIVSDYTKTRINDIIKKALLEAWVQGFDNGGEMADLNENSTVREIIDIISECPERVVEL